MSAGLFLILCGHDTPTGPGADPGGTLPGPPPHLSYEYHLRLPVMDPESLSVSIVVDGGCSTTLSFVLPLLYFDNPVDSLADPLVDDVTIADAAGAPIPSHVAPYPMGPRESSLLTIPAGQHFPITLAYRPRVNRVLPADTTHSLPSVFLDRGQGFIIGAYVFAVPYAPRLVDLWRGGRHIALTAELGPGVSVHGIPLGRTAYPNAYALMFVQMAFGAQQLILGQGGDRTFGLYGFGGYSPSPERLIKTKNDLEAVFSELAPLFGGLESTQPYPVFFRQSWGGLEGSHSFTCLYPDSVDTGIVAMVLAHETIHDAVGVRCGEYDDPWWKEGITNYLGWATAARLGLADKRRLYQGLIEQYDSTATLARYAPSSPALRTYLFTDGTDVAYGKGGQIGMLLDLAVRNATDNTKRIDEGIATLCRNHEGRAFTRGQFIAHFAAFASLDIAPLLAEHADRPGAIDRRTLDSAFFALDSLGAFGASGGMVKTDQRSSDRPRRAPKW